MIDLVQLGRLVKAARKSRSPRISQTDLSKMVGVTQSFVSDLENGRLRLGPRDPEKLEAIAKVLGISLEDAGEYRSMLDPTLSMGYLPTPEHPSHFSDKIRTGRSVITMEIHPPKGVGLKRFEREALELKHYADAVNVTDNQRALLKLSSIAASRILLELGLEPICQMTCRDRNRLAMQSDVLSGYVLGIRNFFFIMGDPPEIGDHPDAQPVFDLHSVQALEVASKLKLGLDMHGNALNKAPSDILLGSACNPFALDPAVEISKLKAKARAGAEFFQTQPVYDTSKFKEFLRLVKPLGLKIIAGYIPVLDLKTLEMLESIPGVALPGWLDVRLKAAPDIASEGLAIARDTVNELAEIATGVHLMNVSRVAPSVKVLQAVGRDLRR
jgi:5,10-methylenetetrahydrofolate reductase